MNAIISRCGFALLWACIVVGGFSSIVGAFLGFVIGVSWMFSIDPSIATMYVILAVGFTAAFVAAWQEYGR